MAHDCFNTRDRVNIKTNMAAVYMTTGQLKIFKILPKDKTVKVGTKFNVGSKFILHS